MALNLEFRIFPFSWVKRVDEHPEWFWLWTWFVVRKVHATKLWNVGEFGFEEGSEEDLFFRLCIFKGFLVQRLGGGGQSSPTDAFIDPDLRPTPHLGLSVCTPSDFIPPSWVRSVRLWVLTSPSRILHCVTTRSIVVVNTLDYQEKTPLPSLESESMRKEDFVSSFGEEAKGSRTDF